MPRPPLDLKVRFRTCTSTCLTVDDSDAQNDTDSDTDDDSESTDTDTLSLTDQGGEEILQLQSPKGYRLIDVELLSENIASSLSCKFCNGSVLLYEVGRKGLASSFVFHCENKHCHSQTEFYSCPQLPVGNSSVNTVNRRIAFAMRCIGGDRAELETFCGIMDLPPPVGKSSCAKINDTVHKASTTVQKASMKLAAETEYTRACEIKDDMKRNIDVSSDGTWMTRGHSSKVGVVTTIGMDTGKVLDTESRSKICKSCEYWSKQDHNTDRYRAWQVEHHTVCTMTHTGSSG